MKIGLVGPAGANKTRLRDAVDHLLGAASVDLIVYLGIDDAISEVTGEWARARFGGELGETELLARVEQLAPDGNVAALDRLLEADATMSRLPAIRRLPKPPTRAIEMIGDKIVTLVWDKAVLVEEDIANSFLLAYGKADEVLFRKFGPRYFFTPGPLDGGKLGLLEEDNDGLVLTVCSTAGAVLSREALQGRPTTKMTVSS